MQCYAVNSQLAWKIPRKKPNFETTFNLCIKLRKKKRETFKKEKMKIFLRIGKKGVIAIWRAFHVIIYLFLLHVFVSSFYSEHNCHELTSLGTFAYAVGVPCEPVHSIWLALLCLNYATEKVNSDELLMNWISSLFQLFFIVAPYPSTKDLINCGRLLKRAFSHNLWPHFFHVQHESV